MLGILLIYFIGKKFYDLALENKKSGWGFAILGVISFYAFQFIFGIILALVVGVNEYGEFDGMSDFGINILGIIVGVIGVVILYYILQKVWAKNSFFKGDLLDEDFL